MKGILGRKLGMTQVFTKEGKLIPVTVIEVKPNTVMQVKTNESDGYSAIQVGIVDKKEARATKPEMGRAKKANTTPKRFLKEIRDYEGTYNIGDILTASVFECGDIVDVTGTSKGHGFTGVIKRHNQSRGPETHGSRYHRRPGSMGTMLPKRVLKGKKLSGHMGVETVTIQNLEVIEVNENEEIYNEKSEEVIQLYLLSQQLKIQERKIQKKLFLIWIMYKLNQQKVLPKLQ